MSELLIEAIRLSKIFNKNKSNEIQPVKEVNLKVYSNKCVVFKGASGSGKSTLLGMLSCLSKPTSGKYICLGKEVSRWSEKFLTEFRRRHLSTIFQQFQLIGGIDVYTNIALPLLPLGYSTQKIHEKVLQKAEEVNISKRLYFKTDLLSGGEMQRVAIARALINDPAIIFADEPTAHLDKANAENILGVFLDLKAKGKTLIISTHDPIVENHPMVDQVYEMSDGRIIYQ